MLSHRGLVLHIQDGTESGTESWFKNPSSQASSHFLNPRSGGLRQMVDTNDKAWAEANGNQYWISIENEGTGSDALTASQIENCAQLLAWLHKTYNVELVSTDSVNGYGLGWHGMGGVAWGDHPNCPGDPIKNQRPAILARATQLVAGTTSTPAPATPAFPKGLAPNKSNPSAKVLQQMLKDTQWIPASTVLSDNYGPVTQKGVAGFNAKHGFNDAGVSYDPAIGPKGWVLLAELAGYR
jgi:hypothetical protein